MNETPTGRTCSISGCEKPAVGRGWCNLHWKRWKNHGDPMPDIPPLRTRQGESCIIDGCDKPPRARGWCGMHYERWRAHGDPRASVPSYQGSIEHRFWMRVNKTETCWPWTGSTASDGYGYLATDDGPVRVHRLAYELLVEPIPDGLQIDHACGNRACVNPGHLRLATPKQNAENIAGLRSDNTSGARGVWWRASMGKWEASVTHFGKRYHVGYFSTLEEARDAAAAKRNQLFTHNDRDRHHGN